MNRRAAAGATLAAGLLLIAVARLIVPTAPPLYDGVVPIVPYVWLDPPPGQPGGAQGASAEIAVRNGKSPLVAVATPELEPQAQIFAQPGGLGVTAGSEKIRVSIQPVPAEGVATDGHVDGNVYRISVTDASGTPLTAPASARVSVVLRATDPAQAEATIARLSGASWQPLKTAPSGFGGAFLAVVTAFGDFAVIVAGPGPTGSAAQASTEPPGSTGSAGSPPSDVGSGQPAASSAPGAPATSFSPPAWALIAGGIVVLALIGLGLAGLRRRRSRPYRGAHTNRRR